MKVEQNRGDLAQRVGHQQLIDGGEGIVDRIHEESRHRVDDQNLAPVGERENAGALAGRAGRKIDRAQQTRIAVDIGNDLAPVPDVIAGRHHVRAGGVELGADLVGDAEAMRRVLAVDRDEIEAELTPEAWQLGDDDIAPGAADHVAAEKKSHPLILSTVEVRRRKKKGWSRLAVGIALPSEPTFVGGSHIPEPGLRQGQPPEVKNRPRGVAA